MSKNGKNASDDADYDIKDDFDAVDEEGDEFDDEDEDDLLDEMAIDPDQELRQIEEIKQIITACA